MRAKSIVAAAVALASVGLAAPRSAEAFGDLDRYRAPPGVDPYAYKWSPRGYYPYYNSDYWRPASEVRTRYSYKLPKYYPAWGYPVRRWDNTQWHEQHHGGHYRWEW